MKMKMKRKKLQKIYTHTHINYNLYTNYIMIYITKKIKKKTILYFI